MTGKIIIFLEYCIFKFRSWVLYLELNQHIKQNKSYLKKIHMWDRDIGKTYNLVKLSVKYNAPILIYQGYWKEHIQAIAYKYFKTNVKIICATETIRGYKGNLLLVEEGVPLSVICDISDYFNCVVGYENV